MTPARRQAVAAALLVAALAGWSLCRRPALVSAPPIPHANVQPWMAEALPFVGPKSAERMTAAIRAGERDALPTRAQTAAAAWFAW